MEFGVALNCPGDNKVNVMLTHCVKLSLTSTDNVWTSRVVYTVITPGLCMPIILGLPFLETNNIVCDHANQSCIDKVSSYNLLNPVKVFPPPPPRMKAKDQIKFTKLAKKLTLAELMIVSRERIREKKQTFEDVKPLDVIGAVRTTIEKLATAEHLTHLGDEIKSEFKQIFEPIPHVTELPTDYYAHIRLKNAEKTIQNRLYPCPRKYRDAWHILLDKHLHAGQIRPSSSATASPSFIIPKADPTALPRWVNDYRQLNANTIPNNHPLPRIDDILNNCTKGKIWSTIDMTNSFYKCPCTQMIFI